MADISMCNGKDCPIKEKCYRFTAPKGVWQSYYTETPGKWNNNTFTCDKYKINSGKIKDEK